MTTDLAVRDPSGVAMTRRGVDMRSRDDVVWLATVAAEAQPQRWKRKADACLAIVVGMEAGFTPAQALQKLYVVNGKVAMECEAATALVISSPLCESLDWRYEGREQDSDFACIATAKRSGQPKPVECSFSVADAKKAGLWGKSGPWSQYPKRMLRARAVGFLLRDRFPDVLCGISILEEVQDYAVNTDRLKLPPSGDVEDPLLADDDESGPETPGDADGGVVDADYVEAPQTQESEPEAADESIRLDTDSSPQAEEGGAPVKSPTDAPAEKGVGAETPPPASVDGRLTFWQKRLKDVRKAVGTATLATAAQEHGFASLAALKDADDKALKAICTTAEEIAAESADDQAARKRQGVIDAIMGFLPRLEDEERDALWQLHGLSPDELDQATDQAIGRLHDDLVGIVLEGQ